MTGRRVVAVVGAGITGATSAYHLAQAGADVLVVDAEGVGAQSSTQTAGNLHLQLSYTAMKDGEESFRRHVTIGRLNDDAGRQWQALASAVPGIRVERTGGLVVAETDDDVAQLRRKASLEREVGFATEFVDGSRLRELAPELGPEVIGAAWHPEEGYVDARSVCHRLVDEVLRSGGELAVGSPLVDLAETGDRWTLSLADGRTFTVDGVVLAVGAWTGLVLERLGLDVPMHVEALTMSVCERAPTIMRRLVMHASRPLSVKQVHSGNVMIGGGRPAVLVETDDVLRWRTAPAVGSILAGMVDSARVVPATSELRLIRSWEGILGSPADDLPVVGLLPGRPGLAVAVAGHTGYTLGPSIGRAAAQLLLGETTDVDLAPFSPARFDRATEEVSA